MFKVKSWANWFWWIETLLHSRLPS